MLKSKSLVVLLGTIAIAAAPASAQTTPPTASAAVNDLFVLTAAGGELERIPGRRREFKLTLRRPARAVTAFSDRPARTVGKEALARFVRDWRRLGFSRVPPNAALVVDNAPTSRDVAVFELSQPRLAGASLTFRARSLARRPTGVLQRLARRADRLGEAAFGRASLFIDSAPKQLTLVFNVTGNDTVVTQNFQMQFFTATVAGPLVLRSDAAVDSIFGSDGFRVSGPLNDPYSSTFEVPISLSAKDTSVNVQVDIDAGLSATVQVKGNPPPAYPLTAGRYLVPLN